MSFLISIIVALIAGISAGVCMLVVALGWVEWYRIPSHEGASSFFVLYCVLLAAFVGTISGLIVARKVGPGFAVEIFWAVGINVLLCAMAAMIGYLFAPKPSPSDPSSDTVVPQTGEQRAIAEKQRAHEVFNAIPLDAPLTAWFPYTGEGGGLDHRAAAVRHIQSKPGYVTEINALLISPDRHTAVEALRLVTQLPMPPPPELKAGVAACGQHLAEMIRQVNATPQESDPSYELAGETAVRFNAWMAVIRLLRDPANGGTAEDFIPQLGDILTLSRKRPEIHAMRQDILRVASYHAHQWAGIPPLPDDPAPR
jgi:hypothetical protein